MLHRRIARPMLASVFVAGGVDAIRNPAGRAVLAQGFVDGTVTAEGIEAVAARSADSSALSASGSDRQ